MDTHVRFSSNTPDILISNQSTNNSDENEPEPREPEKVVLLSIDENKDVSSREFVDEIDEIMSKTDKLYIRSVAPQNVSERLESLGATTVYDVLNGSGERVFRLGRCAIKGNTQTFVVANDVGHGVMTLTTKGFLGRNCDVEGAGLLKFTQIHHLNGGYTLRDTWKELLKIRSSWVPFCTCCLLRSNSSATLAVVNLDGTPTGTICFKKWLNLGFDDRTLCVHFIPNLNPKAKYMLFAASLGPLCSYFSEPGKSSRGRLVIFYYLMVLSIIIIVTVVLFKVL